MRGRTNTTGVKESDGTFELLPEGEYLFEISEIGEKETKNGDPMAILTLVVKEGSEYDGRQVWDNIVIPNQGSPSWKIMGRTKHFLHCINEPYEGEFDWDTSRWLFKKVKAAIKHVEQTDGKYAGKMKATVSNYILVEESAAVAADDPWAN